MSNTRTQKKWPHHSGKRDQKSRQAGFLHAVDVGLKPCDEHQDQAADLCHQHQRTRGLAPGKHLQVEQVERTGSKNDPNHQFAQNRWDVDARKQRRAQLSRRQQDSHKQRELKYGRHQSDLTVRSLLHVQRDRRFRDLPDP